MQRNSANFELTLSHLEIVGTHRQKCSGLYTGVILSIMYNKLPVFFVAYIKYEAWHEFWLGNPKNSQYNCLPNSVVNFMFLTKGLANKPWNFDSHSFNKGIYKALDIFVKER